MNANFSIIYTCKIYEILSDKEAKNIFKFYHASLQVLSDDIYPFVNVEKVFRSKEYVDFYINDNYH